MSASRVREQGMVATMRLPLLVALLVIVTGCETDSTPSDAAPPPPAGSCTLTPVPNVSEFFELSGISGCGFRYSGAPVALSLEIYIQTIPQVDWKDDEKRKAIVRGGLPDEKDREVNWHSISDDLIKFYESGKMSAGDADILVPPAQGRIVFTIPDQWFKDHRVGFVRIHGDATADGKTVGGGGTIRFQLGAKFRDLDTTITSRSSATPRFPSKPVTIAAGATTTLIAVSETVSFGDGDGESPRYRMVYLFRARCLRPPVVSKKAAVD